MHLLSVDTQQKTYISENVKEMRVLLSQQWVRKTILSDSSSSISKNIKFSEKSQQKLLENMKEMRKERNAKFYERQAFKEKGKIATENRVITVEVKRACFKLIIELGRTVKLHIFRTTLNFLVRKQGLIKCLASSSTTISSVEEVYETREPENF